MAETLPVISNSAWVRLREQFRKTLPQAVTTSYLVATLGFQENSASSLIGNLRTVGLIDERGKPTELAAAWRLDDQYAGACRMMFESVYPQELRDVAPPPDPSRNTVVSWMMTKHKVGEGAAKNLAATYLLFAKGEVPNANKSKAAAATPRTPGAKIATPAKKQSKISPKRRGSEVDDHTQNQFELPRPQIAVQVNIDPSASPEQIDAIFGSMARHIYGRTSA